MLLLHRAPCWTWSPRPLSVRGLKERGTAPLLTGTPKQILRNSSTASPAGAEPVMITRTRPPNSFCSFLNTRRSHIVEFFTMPLQQTKYSSTNTCPVSPWLVHLDIRERKITTPKFDRTNLSSMAFLLLKALVNKSCFSLLALTPCITCNAADMNLQSFSKQSRLRQETKRVFVFRKSFGLETTNSPTLSYIRFSSLGTLKKMVGFKAPMSSINSLTSPL